MKLVEVVDRFHKYPKNHICKRCDFIIPVEWLVCENCGKVQSRMNYQDLKYYRHKRDKRQKDKKVVK